MPRILYVDSARSRESVRPVEAAIFGEQLPRIGYQVSFLLPNAHATGRCPQTQARASSPGGLIGADLRSFYLEACATIRAETPDVVVVRNDVALGLVTLALARSHRIPFVFIRAFPLEDYIIRNRLHGRALTELFKVRRRVLYWLLRRSSLVVVRSDAYAAHLEDRGVCPSRIVRVPAGFDSSLQPCRGDNEQLRKELGLGDSFVILYLGAMDRPRRLPFLIGLVPRLLARGVRAKLLMVGGRPSEVEELKECARRKQMIDNVRFTGTVSRECVRELCSVADVSVSALPPTPEYVVSTPAKVVESLGLGVPVVVNREILDQMQLVDASGGGVAVAYREQEYVEALAFVASNPEERARMGARGRRYVLRHRSYAKLAGVVDVALREVVAS
jgi:glycosyltransferase involved in cell wall biosynthesis